MDTVVCDREAASATYDCAQDCTELALPVSSQEPEAASPVSAPAPPSGSMPESVQSPDSAATASGKSPWAEWFWLGLHRMRTRRRAEFVARSPAFVSVRIEGCYACIEQSLNPRLRETPVAAGQRVVVSASGEAKAQGVATGMSVHDARKVCPGCAVLPGNAQHYTDFAVRIRRLLEAAVAEVQSGVIGDFLAEINGRNTTDGSVRWSVQRLQRQIFEQTGLNASIGFGSTKRIACLASKVAGPGGVRIVPARGERQFLRSLPVEMLEGVTPEQARRLKAHGIGSAGELRALPKPALEARFGERAGRQLWMASRATEKREVARRPHAGLLARAASILLPTPCISR